MEKIKKKKKRFWRKRKINIVGRKMDKEKEEDEKVLENKYQVDSKLVSNLRDWEKKYDKM